MSFDIAGGLRNLLPGPLDSLRGPYDSLAAANGAVPSTVVNGKNFREGKFVEIGTNGVYKTYWWRGTGQYLNSDLEEYVIDPDLSDYPTLDEVYTKNEVYNKTETLPASQIYAKNQLYTKSQIDQAIIGLSPDSEALIPIFDSKVGKYTISDIRGISNAGISNAYVIDLGQEGDFHVDITDSTSTDNGGNVIVDAIGRRWKRSGSVINVDDFGAKGDGVTDDTLAIQNCFNSIKSYSTIHFSSNKNYKFTRVTLSRANVNLSGNKALLNGIIQIGDETPRTYNCNISDFVFASLNNPIEISKCRRLAIHHNTFLNSDKAVYVMPVDGIDHVNAQINTNDNIFNQVKYCMYVDNTEGGSWQKTSDCHFSRNIANTALITSFHAEGIDGLIYSENVIFTPADAVNKPNKKHHIRINRYSNWIAISNNNFFESGEESIYVENCQVLTITGGNWAWTGQNKPSSIIYSYNDIATTSRPQITISGSDFNCFTKDVVELSGTVYPRVHISAQVYYRNDSPGYIGNVDLSTFDHYVISGPDPLTQYVDATMCNKVVNLKSSNIGGISSKRLRELNFSAISSIEKQAVPIVANTAKLICGVSDSIGGVDNYAGSLIINSKSATTNGANSAIYEINISKSASGQTPIAKVVSQSGLVNGSGTSHPSFYFTIVGDKIYANPINLTAGNFWFYIQSKGNIILID